MTRWSRFWAAIIIVSAAGVDLVAFGHLDVPLRPVIAFWFLLVCPGMALVALLRLEDRLAEVLLAIGLSIGLDLIVAGTLVYAGAYSAEASLAVLSCISVGAAVLQLLPSGLGGIATRRAR